MNENHFSRAASPRPAPSEFDLLDHFDRRDWGMVLTTFYAGCRDPQARPEELLAWTRRDIQSTLADVGRLAGVPFFDGFCEQYRNLLRVIDANPEQARRLSEHALYIETCGVVRRGELMEALAAQEGGAA